MIAYTPFCLIIMLAAYIATSDVIFLPSLTTPRRRFPANASSTSTVIHVITVVLTAITISDPTRKAAAAAAKTSGTTEEASLSLFTEDRIRIDVAVTFISLLFSLRLNSKDVWRGGRNKYNGAASRGCYYLNMRRRFPKGKPKAIS